jgi:hypothetical protein
MNARKKELKELYKQMKPDMGVLIIRCTANDKCLLVPARNLNGMINRLRFQLEMGSAPYKELQNDWKQYGPESFAFEVLDTLAYSKDEAKTDYSKELDELCSLWKDKLKQENVNLY